MATRNLVINDPVGIHARPAAMFAATPFRPAPSCPSWVWASSRATPWSSTSKATTPRPWPTTWPTSSSTPSDLPFAEDFRISQDIQQSSVVASQL